jgi:hypothetical protein
MRNFQIFLWVSFLINFPLICQPATIWTKTFGTANSDGARTICSDNNGGFVIAGYTYSNPDKNSDAYVLKIDSDGNECWIKSFGDEGWEFINSICNTINNDGFIIVGYRSKPDTNSADVYMVKIDNNGNIKWEKNFGGIGIDIGMSVCQSNDNGYLICGTTTSYGAGEDDIYLIKTNDIGDSLWTKTIGCNKSDMGFKAILTSDGHYLVVGSTGLYDTPGISSGRNREIYLVKTDLAGNVVNSKTYWIIGTGQVDFDTGYDVCETADNCYYITGASSREASEVMDISILKVDNQLNQLWKKRKEIGVFYDYGYSVSEITEDHGLIVCGSFNSAETGLTDAFILRLDKEGNEIWRTSFGGESSESFYSIKYLGNGDFIAAGYTNSSGAGEKDFWLAKFHDEISSIKIEDNSSPGNPWLNQNFPNPFNPETKITFQIPRESLVVLKIYNVLGVCVHTLLNEFKPAGYHSVEFKPEEFSSGIYFYSLTTEDNTQTRKMIYIK